jgi:predicted nucleotidyltransferase
LSGLTKPECLNLRFDIIDVFLHGGVAEKRFNESFSDIDSESWNEDYGEVK